MFHSFFFVLERFCVFLFFFFFFFNDTATTEIYTLSLHDALPISSGSKWTASNTPGQQVWRPRSEEHTSELQSLRHLVCRLLLEKKKKNTNTTQKKKKKKKKQNKKHKQHQH